MGIFEKEYGCYFVLGPIEELTFIPVDTVVPALDAMIVCGNAACVPASVTWRGLCNDQVVGGAFFPQLHNKTHTYVSTTDNDKSLAVYRHSRHCLMVIWQPPIISCMDITITHTCDTSQDRVTLCSKGKYCTLCKLTRTILCVKLHVLLCKAQTHGLCRIILYGLLTLGAHA